MRRPFTSRDKGECRAIRFRLLVSLAIVSLLGLHAGAQSRSVQDPSAHPLQPSRPVAGTLSVADVVRNLVAMNLHRMQALQSYNGMRTYHVDYRGFPGSRTAEMIVKVNYSAPVGKEFTVESSSGSSLIIDRVFKKLLEAEKEAQSAEMQRRTALNEDNYEFTLEGFEPGMGGDNYVLGVVPRKKDKFLYRGRIWVNAVDFAVVRLEAEPAKNPSFWTKKANIVQVYKKVNDFWLPASNHSVSAIRLGGQADLNIDYKDYQITGAMPVSGLPNSLPNPRSQREGAQEAANNEARR